MYVLCTAISISTNHRPRFRNRLSRLTALTGLLSLSSLCRTILPALLQPRIMPCLPRVTVSIKFKGIEYDFSNLHNSTFLPLCPHTVVQRLLVFDRLSRGTPFLQLIDQTVYIELLSRDKIFHQWPVAWKQAISQLTRCYWPTHSNLRGVDGETIQVYWEDSIR
jgi:hypothetical protein